MTAVPAAARTTVAATAEQVSPETRGISGVTGTIVAAGTCLQAATMLMRPFTPLRASPDEI